MNALRTSPSGLYLKLVNFVILTEFNHPLNNLWRYDSNNFVCLSVGLELFWMVGKVNLLYNSAKKVALVLGDGMQKTHVRCLFVFSATDLGCRECWTPFLIALRFAAVEAAYSEADKDLIALSGRYRSPVASLPCVDGLPLLVRHFCFVQFFKDCCEGFKAMFSFSPQSKQFRLILRPIKKWVQKCQ